MRFVGNLKDIYFFQIQLFAVKRSSEIIKLHLITVQVFSYFYEYLGSDISGEVFEHLFSPESQEYL